MEVFESFGSDSDTSALSRFVFLMGPVLPILQNLPTKQNRTLKRLNSTMRGIADELLARNRKATEEKSATEDKSIIGLLSMSHSLSYFELCRDAQILLFFSQSRKVKFFSRNVTG